MIGLVSEIIITKLIVNPGVSGLNESELELEKKLKGTFGNFNLSDWPRSIYGRKYPESLSKRFVIEGNIFFINYRGVTNTKFGQIIDIHINKESNDSYKLTSKYTWLSNLFNGKIRDIVVLGQHGKDLVCGGVIIGYKPAILLYLLTRQNGLCTVIKEPVKGSIFKDFIDFVSPIIDDIRWISLNENMSRRFVKSSVKEIERKHHKNILEEKFNLSQKGFLSTIKNLF